MLAERRHVLSFVHPSSRHPSNKENVLLAGLSSRSRLQSAHARRRCASIFASNSHTIGAVARRHRARVHACRHAPGDVRLYTEVPNAKPLLAQHRLTLPRRLARPKYRPIDPDCVTAVDPSLKGVPLSYIQHSLTEIGPQMLRAACKSAATPPENRLPREIPLTCNDISVEPPSHMLAVYSRIDTRVTLFPAHALVLATCCAHLPRLPRSRPDTPSTPDAAVVVPVVPLRIPSPATFPALLSYLYTKRIDHLLGELLPLGEALYVDELARKHATSCSVKTLIGNIRKVHGMWGNASALGIFDDHLFRTLDLAWEVLLKALAMASGRSLDAGIEVNED